jgi:hypothetical protein
MTSSPFKSGSEPDWKRVVRTLSDNRVVLFNLQADMQRRFDLVCLLHLVGRDKRLARDALWAEQAGFRAAGLGQQLERDALPLFRKAAAARVSLRRRGALVRLLYLTGRDKRLARAVLRKQPHRFDGTPVDLLVQFFRLGWREAGTWKNPKGVKAIVTLMETPNALDDTTKRHRRRRAWRTLERENEPDAAGYSASGLKV